MCFSFDGFVCRPVCEKKDTRVSMTTYSLEVKVRAFSGGSNGSRTQRTIKKFRTKMKFEVNGLVIVVLTKF